MAAILNYKMAVTLKFYIYIYIYNIFRLRYFTFVRTVIPSKMNIISILLTA